MHWDLFGRVIDNFGDAGVCWRLAADVASRGHAVRLWLDDTSALAWMAPHGANGVTVRQWTAAVDDLEPGDVVVEAFGCDPPPSFVLKMATNAVPPVWINLEYLSAESFAERSHGLGSPQWAGPDKGLQKWFFYPGFTARTGGLIRERDLLASQRALDPAAWLARQHVPPSMGALRVGLFCYDTADVAALLDSLAPRPTLLLATAGAATNLVRAQLGPGLQRRALQAHTLPFMPQPEFDALLWSCDLNFVRGEDSFVRAQWAGKPFVWQIYPQHDGAHAAKLHAFLDLFLAGADEPLADGVRRIWRAWNGLPDHRGAAVAGDMGAAGAADVSDAADTRPDPATTTAGRARPQLIDPVWLDAWLPAWNAHCQVWRDSLLRQRDLSSQLLDFAVHKRRPV
jgi:uncharacterized repeat protein (TIGR03837 family)